MAAAPRTHTGPWQGRMDKSPLLWRDLNRVVTVKETQR